MQKNLRKQSNVVFHGEVHGVDHGVVRHNAWFKFWGGVFHDQNRYWCTVSRLINAHCTSTVSGHARSSGPELQQQDWACLACFQKHIFVINIWWIYWISCHTLIDSRFVFGTSSPLLQCILVLSPVSLVRQWWSSISSEVWGWVNTKQAWTAERPRKLSANALLLFLSKHKWHDSSPTKNIDI